MGTPHAPLPVKLFVGMLSADPVLFDSCAEILRARYGPIDRESQILPWDRTEYYREEMGTGLGRKFLFFERLIDPGDLAEIKRFTDTVERDLGIKTGNAVRRRINLDPGYITEAKVVLASTKDFSHRLYIGSGIYAEVTLQYRSQERAYAPLEHTFPDYRSEAYRALFGEARDRLRTALSIRKQEG